MRNQKERPPLFGISNFIMRSHIYSRCPKRIVKIFFLQAFATCQHIGQYADPQESSERLLQDPTILNLALREVTVAPSCSTTCKEADCKLQGQIRIVSNNNTSLSR